jgi:hypothetical protein
VKLITASSSELASHCLAPWGDGAVWDDFRPNWAMRIGSSVHDAMETWLLGADVRIEVLAEKHGLTARQVEVVEASWKHVKRYLETEWGDCLDEVVPEAKFAMGYDMQAVSLGHGSGRDYDAAAGKLVAATLDVFVIKDGVARLAELKVGRGHHNFPDRHFQVRCQSLLATKAHGVSEIASTLLQVNEGGAEARTARLDVFDLLSIEDDWARIAQGDVTPKPGPWCGRCRVQGCPVRFEKEGKAA